MDTIDLNNIKLVIFDFDNTIYNYDVPHNIALNTILEFINVSHDIFIQAKHNIKQIHKNTALEHDKSLQIKELFRLANIKDTVLLEIIINMYYETFYKNIFINNKMLDFIKNVKTAKLVILTNNTLHNQLHIFNKLELYKYFDDIFTSYRQNYIKVYQYYYIL